MRDLEKGGVGETCDRGVKNRRGMYRDRGSSMSPSENAPRAGWSKILMPPDLAPGGCPPRRRHCLGEGKRKNRWKTDLQIGSGTDTDGKGNGTFQMRSGMVRTPAHGGRIRTQRAGASRDWDAGAPPGGGVASVLVSRPGRGRCRVRPPVRQTPAGSKVTSVQNSCPAQGARPLPGAASSKRDAASARRAACCIRRRSTSRARPAPCSRAEVCAAGRAARVICTAARRACPASRQQAARAADTKANAGCVKVLMDGFLPWFMVWNKMRVRHKGAAGRGPSAKGGGGRARGGRGVGLVRCGPQKAAKARQNARA